MSTRQNIAAGIFYESGFNELNKQIESCFLHKLGPGELPERRKEKEVVGIIVPHAGYSFSGPCAAWGYKDIAESTFADTYIIIGPTHKAQLGSSISLQDWQSGIGTVYTDKIFAEYIGKITNMSFAEGPHQEEHAIETQIPFLQFATKDKLGKLKIVAITLGEDINEEKIEILLTAINETAKELNRTFCLIISSDFLHHGPKYNYEPFVYSVKDNIDALNGEIFDLIKARDVKPFLTFIRQKQPTICGYKAIALLMNHAKNRDMSIVLRQYYSSDEITKDISNSVSYASFSCF